MATASSTIAARVHSVAEFKMMIVHKRTCKRRAVFFELEIVKSGLDTVEQVLPAA